MKKRIPILLLLVLCGCSRSTITSNFPSALKDQVPSEALEYVEEKFELFGANPITELSETFAFRILKYGGFSGYARLTEIIELENGTAVVSYRMHDLRSLKVERKEFYPIISGLDFRLKLSDVHEWPILWRESDEIIDDGMSYVIEVYSKGEYHVAVRSTHAISHSEPDSAFIALLEGLKEYEK